MLNNNQALRAARQGRAIHKYADEGTVTGSFVVQTAAAMYYDIPAGKQVVVNLIMAGCHSVDEFASVYLVGCTEKAGAGSPTQFMHRATVTLGSKKDGNELKMMEFMVPVVLKYSAGHRSVSMAVKATDSSTVVSYCWCGWVEDEGTLS